MSLILLHSRTDMSDNKRDKIIEAIQDFEQHYLEIAGGFRAEIDYERVPGVIVKADLAYDGRPELTFCLWSKVEAWYDEATGFAEDDDVNMTEALSYNGWPC